MLDFISYQGNENDETAFLLIRMTGRWVLKPTPYRPINGQVPKLSNSERAPPVLPQASLLPSTPVMSFQILDWGDRLELSLLSPCQLTSR